MSIENQISNGLVEPEMLHDQLNIGNPLNIKIIDGTFTLPGSAENPHQNYYQHRIGDAIFFDIKDIADKQTPLPHMLPNEQSFNAAISRLGIENSDLIVIYGQSGMTMGPARVWWMFKTFGHENVAVLNGGLPAWVKEGFALNTAPPLSPKESAYNATLNPDLVRNKDQVLESINDKSALILDARPQSRFNGTEAEPRPNMRAGHMPGAINIPTMSLIDQETGKLKDTKDLNAIFDDAGLKPTSSVITTCGSGVTACVIALALNLTGRENIPVYDGSWSEWGQEDLNLPVEKTQDAT